MRRIFLEKLWLSFPWKVSIQRKLLVAILAAVVVFGTVHIALIYSIITDEVEEQFVTQGVRLAHHLAGEIEESLLYDDIRGVENALWQWVSTVQEHKYALVVSPTGRVSLQRKNDIRPRYPKYRYRRANYGRSGWVAPVGPQTTVNAFTRKISTANHGGDGVGVCSDWNCGCCNSQQNDNIPFGVPC
jgi:hypothetical protein